MLTGRQINYQSTEKLFLHSSGPMPANGKGRTGKSLWSLKTSDELTDKTVTRATAGSRLPFSLDLRSASAPVRPSGASLWAIRSYWDALMPSDFRFRPASTLALPITHLFPVLAILMVVILPLVTVLVLGSPFWQLGPLLAERAARQRR